MPCQPHHSPSAPRVDFDSHDALEIALATLADRRCALHWGDPGQHISLLTSLILEAQSQLTLKIEQALEDGYSWNQIRDHLGIPHPQGRH